MIRPLHKINPGVWRSRDGRWRFVRAHSEGFPHRWFAYHDDEEFPSNEGQGHTSLGEAAEWAALAPGAESGA